MTCAHVLSPKCKSAIIRSNPQVSMDEPDAALIDGNNPCFEISRGTRKTKFTSATYEIINTLVNNQTTVTKLNKSANQCPGFVYNQVHLLPSKEYGHAIRFPHLIIKPKIVKYFFGLLKIPMFSRFFSRPGDSGTWVIENGTGVWLGMIVADDGYNGSYIIEGKPLLEYFELNLQNKGMLNQSNKLIPFTFN